MPKTHRRVRIDILHMKRSLSVHQTLSEKCKLRYCCIKRLPHKHLQEVRERLLKEEQERIAAENKPYLDALKEDFEKLEAEVKKGCKEFLTYINDTYVPAEKKLDLKEGMLKESQLKKTMVKSFVPIFHPDKNVNEEKKVQLLREEIWKYINNFVEQFKGNINWGEFL